MKNRMKRILAAAMTCALLVTAVLALASCGNDTDKNTIHIGASGPLTGDTASYGISVRKGADLAIEKINAAGGLNGLTFRLTMLDDQATSTQASINYDTLLDKGIHVSIGAVTTDACAAFGEKAMTDNLFYITPSASAASVIAGRPNGYRICFSDPQQGEIAAAYICDNGYSNIGAIYNIDDAYSKGIYDAFAAKMNALGKSFTARQFDNNNKTDFSTQVEALADCDIIFLPMYYTEASLIASKATEKGCNAILFGSDGFDGIARMLAPNVTNTIKYITPFDADSTDPVVKEFVEAYKAKYDGAIPDQFAADGYDAVMAIYEAMKKADVRDTNRTVSEFCDLLRGVLSSSDFSLNGVTGKMTWDNDGVPTKAPQIKEIKR